MSLEMCILLYHATANFFFPTSFNLGIARGVARDDGRTVGMNETNKNGRHTIQIYPDIP